MSILEDSQETQKQKSGKQETVSTKEADRILEEQKKFDEKMRDIEKQARTLQGNPKDQQLFYDKAVYTALTGKEVSGIQEKINDAIYMNTGRSMYKERSVKHLKTVDKNIDKAERELEQVVGKFEGEIEFQPTRTIDDFVSMKESTPQESKGTRYQALEAKREAKIYERKIQDMEVALLQYSAKEEEIDNKIEELRTSLTTPGNLALISELEDVKDEVVQKQEEVIGKIEDYSVLKEAKDMEYEIADTKFLNEKNNLSQAQRKLMEEKSKRRFLDLYIKTDGIIEYGNVIQSIGKVTNGLKGYTTVLQHEQAKNKRAFPTSNGINGKSFSGSVKGMHDKAKLEDSKYRVELIKKTKDKYRN
ncbi:hypothetical protein K9M74_00840 [Candidatus Woesearchaeota archaeon]|nr:hypothetical protein [Candidatus Woesearchaeota archaeon]